MTQKQTTRKRFEQLLRELFELWLAVKHQQGLTYEGYEQDHIGEQVNPRVIFRIEEKSKPEPSKAVNEMLNDIGLAIAREDALAGNASTTKL
jgi:hypothetical protein